MALRKNFKNSVPFVVEYFLTFLAGCLTLFGAGVALYKIGLHFETNWVVSIIYAMCFLIFVYGNIYYLLARFGHLRRSQTFKPSTKEELEAIYNQDAPTVTFLLPSYKEEIRVIRQSVFSSALQEYPFRRVVLLIDDPSAPKNKSDLEALMEARQLVIDIQDLLNQPYKLFHGEFEAFLQRANTNQVNINTEQNRLSFLYQQAIDWFDGQADQYPLEDHTDTTFVRLTFIDRAIQLRQRAEKVSACNTLEKLRYEFYRLSTLFHVEISSFERKQYVNLSHASNKAMNLNSYIGLMGKNFAVQMTSEGLILAEVAKSEAELSVPNAKYVAMLDADSVLTYDYTLRLIQVIDSPENSRLAIIQTPYSAFPHSTEILEKIAGATTDIGYIVHQGLTYFNATFWVGANAVARKTALDEIAVTSQERGYTITRYIQDRTVIEDTESTIDLVDRGWTLYNYPERLSYSATPPDFGSLLIQRRRWANGGILILPKLLCYMFRRPWSWSKLSEGFFRFYYLSNIFCMILALAVLSLITKQEDGITSWILVSALPYFMIYARDLKLKGYDYFDLVRVTALNLLLIPVNAAGVLKSIQQAITGVHFPFCRTPKIQGRTTVPALYVGLEYTLFSYLLWEAFHIHSGMATSLAMMCCVMPFLYAIVMFMGVVESIWDVMPLFRKFAKVFARAKIQKVNI